MIIDNKLNRQLRLQHVCDRYQWAAGTCTYICMYTKVYMCAWLSKKEVYVVGMWAAQEAASTGIVSWIEAAVEAGGTFSGSDCSVISIIDHQCSLQLSAAAFHLLISSN